MFIEERAFMSIYKNEVNNFYINNKNFYNIFL